MTMPAGEYYIGDLCYVMHDEWDEVCGFICDHERGSAIEGEFTLKDGRRFAVYNTAYGDGVYYDQHDNDYGVDAGVIGCIRTADISESDKENIPDGHVHLFEKEFPTYTDGGKLYFGDVVIDTDPDYEEEYDDEA
jgi:hypothetical protein